MLQLLLSLLAISGIGALLALLLELADSYIADYGESHILINEEKDLLVNGGSPLLFTLMDQKIFIPSACGGKGTCALCKVKISEGGGPVLPTETPYLSKEEREDLADQLRRVSKAVPRLIAEGYVKRHQRRGFQKYLHDALAERNEMIVSLSHARDLYSSHVDPVLCNKLIDIYDKTSRQFYLLAKKWENLRKR